ncbi:tetratricopeptide repeat protein [Psychroflexus tropicus]|uniref:tetratricopeptide repeat protein n=1 Tax=Psychroflexus tropicus TaxID=197345 RepID=UPI00035D7145|nr:tetratricopeptide repeat protein [Psychroflexus tropicus]
MSSQNKINIIFLLVCFLGNAQVNYSQDLDSLYAVGNYAKILEHFEAKPATDFKHIILEAKILQAKGYREKAILKYGLALSDRTDAPLPQFAYAKLLKSNNYIQKADSVLTLLHNNYPGNPEFAFQLGLAKAKQKNASEELYFEKALEQDPSHQKAAYELAKFYYKIKSYEKAETTSLKALVYSSKNKKIIGLLGQIYYAQRKFKLALDQFEHLEELSSPPKFVLEKMAIAYKANKQLDKSVTKYQQILRIEPKSYKYHLQLAQVYAHQNKFEDSEYHARMAIAYKDTSLGNERFTKAIALKELGKLKEAITEFKLVIDEAPGYERAYVELALTADRLYKDTDKKLSFYDRYEQRFKDSKYAEYKDLMYRRITDLKREQHFQSGN